MKKLIPITTILLSIFLPMAAQADQWACESTHRAGISTSIDLAGEAGEYTLNRMIIDTNKGFKTFEMSESIGEKSADNPFGAPEFKGQCSFINTKNIRCEDTLISEDYVYTNVVVLQTYWGLYSFLSGAAQSNADGTVELGACTKL
jgi:hypothetical protein